MCTQIKGTLIHKLKYKVSNKQKNIEKKCYCKKKKLNLWCAIQTNLWLFMRESTTEI